jgi:hypothetical protein
MGHADTATTLYYLRDVVRGDKDLETVARLGYESAAKMLKVC